MSEILKHDRTLLIEALQGSAFFLMALALSLFHLDSPDSSHSLFWVSLFGAFSVLQLSGAWFKDQLYFLRLVMTWVSGVTWVWMSWVSINNVISIPVFCIGIFSLYAFGKLGMHISEHMQPIMED